MSEYRPFRLGDLPLTLARCVIGALLGFGAVGMVFLLKEGLWLLLVLLIPIMILHFIGQMLFDGIIYGIAWLWRAARGKPRPTYPPRPAPLSVPPEPWILHHGLLVGFVTSATLLTAQAWRSGAFGAAP
ncbi:hypothetical protein V8J82_04515 [Gymnodinialimonas sp. 2305UL16-5]|uniref:hypothetical protein n=1 Tax=Gymnodinialimonas mytili TaxID=3126503 RepID=UPI003095B656